MMSADHTYRSPGRVIPLCRTCRQEATQVIAYPDADALPFCPMCANAAIENAADAREYPIEEYYAPATHRICQFDPHNAREFELYDPDNNDHAWLCADNADRQGSSVDVVEWC